jgi:hypothetical protein
MRYVSLVFLIVGGCWVRRVGSVKLKLAQVAKDISRISSPVLSLPIIFPYLSASSTLFCVWLHPRGGAILLGGACTPRLCGTLGVCVYLRGPGLHTCANRLASLVSTTSPGVLRFPHTYIFTVCNFKSASPTRTCPHKGTTNSIHPRAPSPMAIHAKAPVERRLQNNIRRISSAACDPQRVAEHPPPSGPSACLILHVHNRTINAQHPSSRIPPLKIPRQTGFEPTYSRNVK